MTEGKGGRRERAGRMVRLMRDGKYPAIGTLGGFGDALVCSELHPTRRAAVFADDGGVSSAIVLPEDARIRTAAVLPWTANPICVPIPHLGGSSRGQFRFCHASTRSCTCSTRLATASRMGLFSEKLPAILRN